MRTLLSFVVFGGLLFVVLPHASRADEEKKETKEAEPFLTVRLVDEQGTPVADAQAGIWAIVRNFDGEMAGEWNFRFGGASDANGIVRFREGADVFRNRPVIIARHAGRHLMGVHSFADKNLAGVTDITLRPECHVQWKFASNQVKQAGRELGRLNVIVTFEGMICSFTLIKGSTYHTLLPPGEFAVECIGGDVTSVSKKFEIKADEKSLDLGTSHLDANQLILLEGKPAPELDDIVEWKNGPALRLTELRGKVVLLEFWGWWCGPCVQRGIPELFKLQDEFQGKDLVIIGIHTPADESDTIDSIAKLDDKLAKVREKTWKGRDITFPVALSRVKLGSYSADEPMIAASKLCFDYGVSAFPTSVLIDREGKVIGKFEPGKEEDLAKLKKLLDDK